MARRWMVMAAVTMVASLATDAGTQQRARRAQGGNPAATCRRAQSTETPAPQAAATQQPAGQRAGRGGGCCRKGNAVPQGAGRGNGNGRGNGGCARPAGRSQGAGRGAGQGAGRGRQGGRGLRARARLARAAEPEAARCTASLQGATTTVEVPPAYLQRLQDTLAEELFARDFYRVAAKTLSGRRWGNLARAEQNHVDAITAAIRFLGGEPMGEPAREVTAPVDLAAADAQGTAIENKVIEIYAGLIEDCPDPKILPVLNNIQTSNQRHLVAVSR